MSNASRETKSRVVPCLRYRNAPAALEWLCATFGFEKQLVVPGGEGMIAHAQLVLGDGMIMLGSATDSEFGRLLKQPDEVAMAATQTIYVVVPDADAVYKRAREVGAKVEIEIRDQEYGGRDFTCRDLEGHVWTFGTYDPWASE